MWNRCILLTILLMLSAGCGRARKKPTPESTPLFTRIYEDLAVPAPVTELQQSTEKRLTLSCERMSVQKFLQFVANETSASIVADEQLDEKFLSFEVTNITLPELLGLVARRLGVQLGRVGSTWYLGQLRGEDRGVLVRKVRRLSAEGVRSAVEVVLSDAGRLSTFPDGLLVCGDRVEALERVRDLLDRVEASPAESWVVQLYLVSVSESKAKELGIKVQPLVELSLALAARSNGIAAAGSAADGAKLIGALSSVLKASETNQGIRIVAQPLFLLLDGEVSKFSSGVLVPIAKKTVSDQGTVTTQGFEYLNAGLECEVSIREISAQLVRFKVSVDMGQVQGFIEQAPIRAKDHFETVAALSAGGVYLLGALTRDEQNRRTEGIARDIVTAKSAEDKDSHVQVWAKVHRVAGPVTKAEIVNP